MGTIASPFTYDALARHAPSIMLDALGDLSKERESAFADGIWHDDVMMAIIDHEYAEIQRGKAADNLKNNGPQLVMPVDD